MAVYFQMMLLLVWPSEDEAHMPRRFRAVLFMDVFEDGGQDPVQERAPGGQGRAPPLISARRLRRAEAALQRARHAVRRWEAVPAGPSAEQAAQLKQARGELAGWYEVLNGEVALRAGRRGVHHEATRLVEMDDRTWDELLDDEQEADPYSQHWTGPFQQQTGLGESARYFFDLEAHEFRWTQEARALTLHLDEVSELVNQAGDEVRQALNEDEDDPVAESSDDGESHGAGERRARQLHSTDSDGVAPGELRRRTLSANVGQALNWAQRGIQDRMFFKPQRLPWQVIKGGTRAVQFAWLGMAVIGLP
ncbi:unnamed protein product, partial [Prorocentrum cordatum]